MSKRSKFTVATSLALSLAVAPAFIAGKNVFAADHTTQGSTTKPSKEGTCGEGTCGGKKKAAPGKAESKPESKPESKTKDGKCAKDGKCGEGKCGAKRKAHEGKCGGESKPSTK